MGRVVGWTLGIVFALALSASPAAAQSRWSVGVHIGSGPYYGPVYYPPVYRAPVYRVPAYDPYYDPYYYEPYYYDSYYYRPVYRDRVVVVGGGRYDRGRSYGRDYRYDRGRSHDRDRGRGYDRDRGHGRRR